MELREGAVIADRFRLVRQLGEGGMGAVWLAQHTALDVPCAVKFIHAEVASNPEVRTRFEREAKAAAQLRSPNVVQILDYGVHEQTPYIAMELLEGEPLNDRLSRRRQLSPQETFRIVAQVGKALTKAHAAGIVHRDLKPENIFLVADEDSEVAKVLDFGVAKDTIGITNSNTRTGALLGTPFYMSPEQAQGVKAVDSRADLWSLAVVTYRCMTGDLPFRSEALGDLLIKIVTHPIPVPSHVAPGLPPGFDTWWQRASQREPAHRFQTAKELVEALGLALGVSSPAALGISSMSTGAGGQVAAAQAAAGADPSWTDSGITAVPAQHPSAAQTGPGAPYAVAPPGAARGATVAATPVGAPGATAAMPGPDGTGASPALGYAPHGGQALGESGSGASVAGYATRATGAAKGSSRGAVVGIVIGACVLLGGAGAFVVYRSSATSGAEADETAAAGTATSSAASEPSAQSDDASGEAASETAAVAPDEAGADAATSSAEPAAPRPKPEPTPAATPSKAPPISTDLGTVEPAPTKDSWGF